MTNLDSLWTGVLTELKLSLSKPIFQTFFSCAKLADYKNQIATIACPNPYLADLIEKRYYSLVKAALDRQTGENASLVFIVEKQSIKTDDKPGPLFQSQFPESPSNLKSSVCHEKNFKNSSLNPNFTFTNFVVGNSNHFAFAAASGIIKNPGSTYNPLFIWGGVGVGKTHLMQAIGHELAKAHEDWKVLYVNAETFGSDLIASFKEQTVNKFKHKYRNVDVLLVDDIQFIAGKESTQEEFFHTFNNLYLAGRQIILTSDRKPEEVQPLEDRLVSRFMGGLTVDIQPPDYEMRVAILKQKIEQRNLEIPEDTISFIAETIQSNARELEGSLIQVSAQASSQGVSPTLEFAKGFFGIKRTSVSKKVSPRKVLSVIARAYKIKTSELTGKCRKANLATARHIAAYFLRKELELPLEQVGLLLGGRDHTTIMHATEKIDRLFSTNQQLRHEVIAIRKEIYS